MIILFLILFSVAGFSQTATVPDKLVRVGFGMAFQDVYTGDYMTFEASQLYLPIDFRNFRIEPTISRRLTREETPIMETHTERETKLGVGLFLKKNYDKTTIYYGIRMGIGEYKFTYAYSSSSSRYNNFNTIRYWGPAMGGEYYFSPHFSIGGETLLEMENKDKDYNEHPSKMISEEIKLRIILRFLF